MPFFHAYAGRLAMTQAILHIGLDGPAAPLPWNYDFNGRGVVLLRPANSSESLAYFKAYSIILVLMDLPGVFSAMQLDLIRQLSAARPVEAPPPVIGIYPDDFNHQSRGELVAAGVDDLISRRDPERFLLWRLDLLLALSGLRHFEQTRLEIGELARSTREQLHDMSQPLSALQGRLQLLASKSGPEDPNAKYFQEMVGLILNVSKHVAEIQQLHRQYS
jgi:signal transduction histidine kinase